MGPRKAEAVVADAPRRDSFIAGGSFMILLVVVWILLGSCSIRVLFRTGAFDGFPSFVRSILLFVVVRLCASRKGVGCWVWCMVSFGSRRMQNPIKIHNI